MAIYIKGMEMPKDDDYTILTVYSDGVVYSRQYKGRLCLEDSTNATEIPEPHGRLIDADEVIKVLDAYKNAVNLGDETQFFREVVDCVKMVINGTAPTVIEGSE